MNSKTEAEFEALKQGFRAGIPSSNQIDLASAEKLFSLLAEYGGPELTGDQKKLEDGTFASN